MPIWINKANIYLFLWFLYYLLSALYWEESFFRQILSSILLGVSFYYFVVVNQQGKLPAFFTGLNILIIMFSVYGIALILGYNPEDYKIKVPSYNYLKIIYRSLLPIYAFYFFSKNGLLTNKTFCMWLFFFFVLVTIEFYGNQKRMLLYAMSIKSTQTEFTNNVGYSFLALLPAISFLKNKPFVQYLALSYCMIFLLLGVKRGAIIIGFLCILLFFWNKLKKNNSIKGKLRVVLFMTGLSLLGFIFVQNQMDKASFFQERVEKTLAGNTSKRDDIFSTMANYFWNEASPFSFVFGSGANSTLKIYKYAHNDWLEIAINQGVLGLMIYVIFWFFFMKTAFMKRKDPYVSLALQMLFVICFFKTFFSMSYGDYALPTSFTLGYSLAQE